jgi:hypothetical protein
MKDITGLREPLTSVIALSCRGARYTIDCIVTDEGAAALNAEILCFAQDDNILLGGCKS